MVCGPGPNCYDSPSGHIRGTGEWTALHLLYAMCTNGFGHVDNWTCIKLYTHKIKTKIQFTRQNTQYEEMRNHATPHHSQLHMKRCVTPSRDRHPAHAKTKKNPACLVSHRPRKRRGHVVLMTSSILGAPFSLSNDSEASIALSEPLPPRSTMRKRLPLSIPSLRGRQTRRTPSAPPVMTRRN